MLRIVRSAGSRLPVYVVTLLELGRSLNLTAAKTLEQAKEILVAPSAGVYAAYQGAAPRLAIDIGSGNGFPGVVVALHWPDCRVVLVERRAKKARAIQACLDRAEIGNAEALACDAREIKNVRPELVGAADLVTLRAVGPLDETTRLAAPLLAPDGQIVHWKRADLDPAERAAGAATARALGLDVLPDAEQPECEGILIAYRKPPE